MKVATHCLFDKGFNDLPIEALPPNVQQLLRANDDIRPEEDTDKITSSDLDFFTYPFADKEIAIVNVPSTNKSESFGFDLADDELYQRVYVKELKAGTCANNVFKTKEGKRRLRGSYITHINGKHVLFNVKEATAKLQDLYDDYKSHVQGGCGEIIILLTTIFHFQSHLHQKERLQERSLREP